MSTSCVGRTNGTPSVSAQSFSNQRCQATEPHYSGVRDKELLLNFKSIRRPETSFKVMGVQTSDSSNSFGERSSAASVQVNESHDSLPKLSGNHAPSQYHSYAINVWGTEMVLTCTADKKIILDSWKGDKSQQFDYGLHQGFSVFCGPAAADGKHYYLGHDEYKALTCQGPNPRDWEHMQLRADPNGGFTLWLYDFKRKDYLMPISELSPTELRMDDNGATRFGFTRLDRCKARWDGNTLSSCQWSNSPTEGKVYAIKIYGTNKAFTRDYGYGLRLREWTNHESQQFHCRINKGFMGFQCEDRFIGYNAQHTIVCSAEKLQMWESIDVRALPEGGFQLWVKNHRYKDWLHPIGREGDDRMAVNETRAIRVSFTLLE